MTRSAALVLASLLTTVVSASGTCLAADRDGPTGSFAVLGALAGTALPSAELGRERARGIAINVNGSGSAISTGTSSANAVIGSPITGLINNDHSIDNNAGITSVLQNFGNNSIMQVSTTINIAVH
ncbi:MAG: hypothetical protein JO007_22085 [Alphaproteobacteria bacterium]|nr:hypothetical protein [Alphaproteobacteria bacterium]